MSRKLLLNSLSGTTLYILSFIVAFIMSPVYIKALGNRDYGLWELVMSVVGYMGLLDLGIGGALVQLVSVADGRQDKNDLQQTISTAFVFFAAIGVVAVIILFALGHAPWVIAGSETSDIANLGTVFILLGINAGMLFPQQVFIATLMGVQRHYFIDCVRAVLLIISASITYYLLQRYPGRGLVIMAMLQPVFTAIQLVLFAGAVYKSREIPKIALSSVTLHKVKEMLAFGAKNATMLVASRLQSQSVPLIIGNMIGLGQIVYFVMPNRLIDYAKGLSQAIGFPLAPYFGSSIGRGNHDELKKTWLNTTLALQIISLAMPVVIFFCGETFLGLWIGKEYATAGRAVLYIMVVGLAADSLATNAFRMLTAQGKHGRGALIWLVFAALSIPLGILGAQLWGIEGVAAATTLVTAMANMITVRMTCKVMQVSMMNYFSKTMLLLSLPLMLITLVFWLLGISCPAKGYPGLLSHVLIAGFVYMLAIWRFTLSVDMRNALIVNFKVMIGRLR
jgi:O-antigen/teichoic acid export membrane protein